ncbi:Biopolymer transport protein ExbB [Pandoraea horticolens]|uniref:Biopolymer transport protein ExbB n=1 Tax=Pandoraea horticolens TaxID=2508298 RepID=A0A5E4VPM6_9BURK|nr:MotA/TolQ/ExbB proton channel family protein [Pandoraea horticolens]VVE14272.1 Biopolymer transport protein ExbB [Pandoraea horticolens]
MLKQSRMAAMSASLIFFTASVTPALLPQLAHAQAASVAAPQAEPNAAIAPAAKAEVAPPAALPAIDGQEKIANPYGLDALWREGDFVSRGTLLILVVMSMVSWYIMVAKTLEQSRLQRRAKKAEAQFWSATNLRAGAAQLDSGSPFRFIAETGLNAKDHHEGTSLEDVDLNSWVAVAIDRAVTAVSNRLQDGMAFLGTVGSTAPFVGLFGTVWGIYHALTAIGVAGQASIDKVAGPVGEALIMTAIGLGVAVPAVLGYNVLVRRNKSVMEQVRGFSEELHTVILSGKRVGTVASKPAVSVARMG